jgi:hypothetical protein
MQHRLPHLSPRGGYFAAPRLAAVAGPAEVVERVGVVEVEELFAMTQAAPSHW